MAISSVSFNGYSNNVRFAQKPQDPQPTATAFRGKDYPYYNEEPKKSKAGKVIGGTLVAAALAILGLGYAHKANALSKLSEGKFKDLVSKCEPAMKKCHEWCAWVKASGKKCVDKVKGWFKHE